MGVEPVMAQAALFSWLKTSVANWCSAWRHFSTLRLPPPPGHHPKITLFDFFKPDLELDQVLLIFFIFREAEVLAANLFIDFRQEIHTLLLELHVFFGAVLTDAIQYLCFGGSSKAMARKVLLVPP